MPKNLKDKRIDLYVMKSDGTDAIGNVQHIFQPLARGLWAYVRQLSQREINQCRVYGSTESMIFQINYRDLDTLPLPGLYVKYKDRYYKVTQIDPYEDRKTDLSLYTERGITEQRLK
ncbi:hypothetical protein EOM86_03150 [Candidatus Nomurabacteria bacterium]|nr:hypothetical protein [Candidatus Nomurabacteria bacterium]